jgi:hypothetical protein
MASIAAWCCRLALVSMLAGAMGAAPFAQAADENDPHKLPVRAVADRRLAVKGARGSGILPLYVSADWTRAQPDVTRAVLVFHGLLRDADVYLKSGEAALAAAGDAGRGTLLIVPQFLADRDIEPHDLLIRHSTGVARPRPKAPIASRAVTASLPICGRAIRQDWPSACGKCRTSATTAARCWARPAGSRPCSTSRVVPACDDMRPARPQV